MSTPAGAAAVATQPVAIATVITDRGNSSAVAFQQAPTAAVVAAQGPAGAAGPAGADGSLIEPDLPSLSILFENGLI